MVFEIDGMTLESIKIIVSDCYNNVNSVVKVKNVNTNIVNSTM